MPPGDPLSVDPRYEGAAQPPVTLHQHRSHAPALPEHSATWLDARTDSTRDSTSFRDPAGPEAGRHPWPRAVVASRDTEPRPGGSGPGPGRICARTATPPAQARATVVQGGDSRGGRLGASASAARTSC